MILLRPSEKPRPDPLTLLDPARHITLSDFLLSRPLEIPENLWQDNGEDIDISRILKGPHLMSDRKRKFLSI